MAVKIYGSLEINEYVEAEGALSEYDGGNFVEFGAWGLANQHHAIYVISINVSNMKK